MADKVLSIVVLGGGRMGRTVVETAAGRDDVAVAFLVSRSPAGWADAPPCLASLDELPAQPDLLIDFSLPDGTRAAAAWCAAHGVPLLSGVTGLGEAGEQALRQAAAGIPVLWSPNLSLGVNLLAALTARTAALLGPDVPVEIEDLHHQWKMDAPSGTALMLGAEVAGQRGGDEERISYASRREGEVIGEHAVRFRLHGEVLELAHRAEDRSIYARGALAAGRWLARQPAGFYTARDWLSPG